MKRTIFALIDCNNFFVSCERLFRPDLEDKPVVVLSSNDGVVIARSNEAKAIGIPMGAPVFKYREILEKHKVISFSANFELYGDISRRITDLLTTVTPRIEIYSIDESFLDLSELPIADYEEWGKVVRRRILEWIGVPVSIGIAPTKTLAKAAVNYAKKHSDTNGTLSLQGYTLQQVLRDTAVDAVWGVGYRLAQRLRAEGAATTLDLARMRPRHAQQLMGIHGRQLVAELNGLSCYPLEREEKPRQSIARTRTFGEDTNDAGAIEAALASFAARAAYRLRESGQVARRLGVFAQTNKHKPGARSWSRETCLNVPTADTGRLISAAVQLFQSFYNPMVKYHRAGVYLWDFLPSSALQTDILGELDPIKEDRSIRRMDAIDDINQRFGRHTVYYASENLGNTWRPKHDSRSPRYVSSWDELVNVNL